MQEISTALAVRISDTATAASCALRCEPGKLTKLILELTSTSDEAQALAAVDRAIGC